MRVYRASYCAALLARIIDEFSRFIFSIDNDNAKGSSKSAIGDG